MDKLAKRFLISGAIGVTSMLTAFGIVAFRAGDKLRRADAVVIPTPVASTPALPSQAKSAPPAPSSREKPAR